MNVGTWLPAVLAAAVSIVVGYFSYKASTQAAQTTAAATLRVKTVEVDAAAYERARAMYESGIKQLEEQIGRLSAQVNEERDASNRLRDQVRALEDLVAQMRRQLIVSGIDVAVGQLNETRRTT